MAAAPACELAPSPLYRPQQRNDLQRLFQDRFGAFRESWRSRRVTEGSERRLGTIERAASAFDACADWERGVARIRCPDCGHDLFRPFSCKSYFLCPSCAQKRSLLLGEYIAEDLLLRLPHRQFVFTIPKALRGFLRRDRRLFGRLGGLIHGIIRDYFSEAAGTRLKTALVVCQRDLSVAKTFGEYAAWHPHFHCIVLEGGLDDHERFWFIPLGANEALDALWRSRVMALFTREDLVGDELAGKMRAWKHSGFSVEAGTRIYDDDERRSLAEYAVRGPCSLEKISWEDREDLVRWKAPVKGHFKGEERCFSGVEFISRVTEHIPPPRLQLVRRFGLYSSRGRGTWKDRPALKTRAPARWYGRAGEGGPAVSPEPGDSIDLDSLSRKKAWARLLKKVYEVDIWRCPDCGGRMEVIALILDPPSVVSRQVV